jgi:Type II secretion system protein C
MKSRISGIVPLLLITLMCIGLVEGGYLLLEHYILETVDKPASETSDADIPAKNPETQTEGATKGDHRIILQRNLFGLPPNTEKSAVSAVQVPKEDLKPTTLEIVLMGTITGSGGRERAIIMDKKSYKQELYEKGDAVQGALVKEISRGKAILSYNGKDEILDISEASKVRMPVKARPPVNPATIAPGQGVTGQGPTGQSSTPLRVVPRPSKAGSSGTPVPETPGLAPGSNPGAPAIDIPGGPTAAIDPGVPAAEIQVPQQPENVNRVKRTLVPQRIYRPSQPSNQQ